MDGKMPMWDTRDFKGSETILYDVVIKDMWHYALVNMY